MIVVSNTSPITNLDAINQLSLLERLFGTILIPDAVFQELTDLETPVPGTEAVQRLQWIQRCQVDNLKMVASFRETLDSGEAEAITLAIDCHADLLLLDERRAYSIAISMDIKVLGVLGILLLAKSRGMIALVQPCMDELIGRAGFWISRSVYHRTLALAQEANEFS